MVVEPGLWAFVKCGRIESELEGIQPNVKESAL